MQDFGKGGCERVHMSAFIVGGRVLIMLLHTYVQV